MERRGRKGGKGERSTREVPAYLTKTSRTLHRPVNDDTGAFLTTYEATGCAYTTPYGQRVTCTVAPGVGKNLRWRISIGADQSQLSSATTAYTAPTIKSVQGATSLSTLGKDTVTLSGENFGPPRALAASSVVYSESACNDDLFQLTCASRRFYLEDCVVTSHFAMNCKSASGVGGSSGFYFQGQIEGQKTAPPLFEASAKYKAPLITSITAKTPAVLTALDTLGSQSVEVAGTNFGEFISDITLTYGLGPATAYTAACTLTNAHDLLTCVTVKGIGAGLKAKVVVAGQESPLSTTTLSYHPPIWSDKSSDGRTCSTCVVGMKGADISQLQTVGGQEVELKGRFFGPSSSNNVEVKYRQGEYTARECSVVSDTVIKCVTDSGVGKGHNWKITVGAGTAGAQNTSFIMPNDGEGTSYSAPMVIQYHGVGATKVLELDTEGNEVIKVEGRNFGSAARTSIDQVSYGLFDGQFNVTVSPWECESNILLARKLQTDKNIVFTHSFGCTPFASSSLGVFNINRPHRNALPDS